MRVPAFVLALLLGTAAQADEIRVLSAGALTEVVTELAEAFHAETGNSAKLTFGTVGTIQEKLKSGEKGDVILLSAPAIEQLAKAGAVDQATVAVLGRVGMGVAVKEGAPQPDIATPEAFKATLLAAKSVAYADPAKGASSGIYFAGLLDRLGIAAEVNAKAILVPGGYVVEQVANGKAELGIHQISEILPVKGITLIGPLPAAIQNKTIYAGAASGPAVASEPARAFLAYLTGTKARAAVAAPGVETDPAR
jgi:molybdate transport system substrate-binding protein